MSLNFLSFFSKGTKSFKKMKSYLHHTSPLKSADIRNNCCKGMISVVLPVYNCEKYLAESIHSVLSQTYTNIELIIVDDGSTDSSGKIADSFISADDRVSVIHQKNMTLPIALNNGFASASGEFLTWTSADNRMLPVCLEILADELCRNRDIDMVFGNMRLIDENGNLLKGHGWYEYPVLSGNVILPDYTTNLNTVANNTIGAAFLYRAGAAKVLNCYSEYKYMLEDYDYFMRMNSLLCIRHILCKKPIYEYRMHQNSLTARDSELGITASRPMLMELDELRRQFYTKELCFYADGEDKELIPLLCRSAKRIFSVQKAEKLCLYSPSRIFYVNLGNCTPSWSPQEVPRFIVAPEPIDGVVDYDVMLCKNSASHSDGWLSLPTAQTTASFMLLRACFLPQTAFWHGARDGALAGAGYHRLRPARYAHLAP